MLKEWTGNLDAIRTTKIRSAADKRVSVVRTVSLSTNRLLPSTNTGNTGGSLVNSALARFALLPESSPMAMVTRAAEARAEASAVSEWLELAKRDEGSDMEAVKRCAESIQSECKWCWGVNTVGDIRLFIKFVCLADTPASVNKFSKTFHNRTSLC